MCVPQPMRTSETSGSPCRAALRAQLLLYDDSNLPGHIWRAFDEDWLDLNSSRRMFAQTWADFDQVCFITDQNWWKVRFDGYSAKFVVASTT